MGLSMNTLFDSTAGHRAPNLCIPCSVLADDLLANRLQLDKTQPAMSFDKLF